MAGNEIARILNAEGPLKRRLGQITELRDQSHREPNEQEKPWLRAREHGENRGRD